MATKIKPLLTREQFYSNLLIQKGFITVWDSDKGKYAVHKKNVNFGYMYFDSYESAYKYLCRTF